MVSVSVLFLLWGVEQAVGQQGMDCKASCDILSGDGDLDYPGLAAQMSRYPESETSIRRSQRRLSVMTITFT